MASRDRFLWLEKGCDIEQPSTSNARARPIIEAHTKYANYPGIELTLRANALV